MIDGLGPNGLADRLHISIDNAKQLISKFFSSFPNIHATLERSAAYGLKYGHIKTIKPFNRVRYFPDYDPQDNASRGSVSRKSKNTRIQGSAADMVKYAMILTRKEIFKNQLPVKMVLQVHDEIVTIVHINYAEAWKEKIVAIMEKAALLVVDTGLLKAEAKISPVWSK